MLFFICYLFLYCNIDELLNRFYLSNFDLTTIETYHINIQDNKQFYYSLTTINQFILSIYAFYIFYYLFVSKMKNIDSLVLAFIYSKYTLTIFLSNNITLFEYEYSRAVMWVFATPIMLATCTGLPLLIAFVVTTAVRLPRVGVVLKVTVNWVAVALVTVPVPLLKVTVLLAAMVSNPVPSMVRVVAVTSRSLVFKVTEGATVAVCPVKGMLFKSTLAFPELKFAVVMSSLPSPFTSPKATESGPSPTAKVA
jgi:hypothetical protein